jgi:hypothetical protein
MAIANATKFQDLAVSKGLSQDNTLILLDKSASLVFKKTNDKCELLGQIAFEEFIKTCNPATFKTEFLPSNCIQVVNSHQYNYYVLQLNPRVYDLKFASDGRPVFCDIKEYPKFTKSVAKEPVTYKIPLPYVQIYIKVVNADNQSLVQQVWISLSNTSVKNRPDTPISNLPLPNCYENFTICWGYNPMPKMNNQADLCEAVVNLFFGAPFNTHTNPANIPQKRLRINPIIRVKSDKRSTKPQRYCKE